MVIKNDHALSGGSLRVECQTDSKKKPHRHGAGRLAQPRPATTNGHDRDGKKDENARPISAGKTTPHTNGYLMFFLVAQGGWRKGSGRGCRRTKSEVAQATRLCRRATRPTKREKAFFRREPL